MFSQLDSQLPSFLLIPNRRMLLTLCPVFLAVHLASICSSSAVNRNLPVDNTLYNAAFDPLTFVKVSVTTAGWSIHLICPCTPAADPQCPVTSSVFQLLTCCSPLAGSFRFSLTISLRSSPLFFMVRCFTKEGKPCESKETSLLGFLDLFLGWCSWLSFFLQLFLGGLIGLSISQWQSIMSFLRPALHKLQKVSQLCVFQACEHAGTSGVGT